MVPALCYAVNNRLFFYTLQFVDGGTFQILSNLKIMTTLLWSVALLRKPFSRNQWAACALLTVGAMLVQGQSVGVDGCVCACVRECVCACVCVCTCVM